MFIHADANDWLSTTRSRVRLRWFPTFAITGAVDYEATLSTGSLVGKPVFCFSQPSPSRRQELMDLAWTFINEENIFATHTLDRVYVEYYSTRLVFTIGRQRIAWGVSNYFRPLDPFAPLVPAQMDKEEQAGTDALRMSLRLGRLSSVEAVYNPYEAFHENYIGVRYRTNLNGWDISALSGSFGRGESVGTSAVGSVRGLGLRTEALFTRSDGHQWVVMRSDFRSDTLSVNDEYLQATLGVEYGFGWRNLTISGEFFYDGSGQTDKADYDWNALQSGNRITLAQHMAATRFSLLITPLLTLSGANLFNIDDGSFMLQTQAEYSISQTSSLIPRIQLFRGHQRTEYGAFPDLYFLSLAYYF
jgi:hypothetical protein